MTQHRPRMIGNAAMLEMSPQLSEVRLLLQHQLLMHLCSTLEPRLSLEQACFMEARTDTLEPCSDLDKNLRQPRQSVFLQHLHLVKVMEALLPASSQIRFIKPRHFPLLRLYLEAPLPDPYLAALDLLPPRHLEDQQARLNILIMTSPLPSRSAQSQMALPL
jgi:predicted lipase